ncbi:MAG: ATP-binding cassette domain-containing protein, partial [Nocardioidaceae bacterium]
MTAPATTDTDVDEGGAQKMIEMRDVVKHYRTRGRGTVHALDGVTMDVRRGETLGIVGESGCGKSTLARLLVRLEDPTSGSISVDGRDIASVGRRQLRQLRRTISMV